MTSKKSALHMGKYEPWFQQRFAGRWQRAIAKLVILGLIAVSVGIIGGTIVNKAVGAEKVPNPQSSYTDRSRPLAHTTRSAARTRHDHDSAPIGPGPSRTQRGVLDAPGTTTTPR